MGKEDIRLKSYLGDARRYADLWNGSVFKGRQLIKAEELEECSPVLSSAGEGIILERTRDLVMMQNQAGQRFAVFSVENQTTVDYGMPVRIMLQEALEYSLQIKRLMRENEKADQEYRSGKRMGRTYEKVYHDAGERLYKIRKEDRIYPVATLIVYWGEKAWKGAKSLHEMIDFNAGVAGMGKELKSLIPEYPLHFLDLTNFKHFEYFQTELRPLLELYTRRNDKKGFVDYIEANEDKWNMDDESWHMLSQLTRSKELKNLMKERNRKREGEKAMCKALIDLKNEGRAEVEGITEGRAESILVFLEEYGEVSENLRRRILEQNNLAVLKRWLKLAARAGSIETFEQEIQ